jgi:thioredoxin-related protein
MKNPVQLFTLILLFLAPQFVFSQNKLHEANSPDGIQWMSFEDAVAKNQTEPRKIFMDVYTSWCGWCKRMDATTFKEQKVIDYLNKKFYAVKFDAETKDTIRFSGHEFTFHSDWRSNELAWSLMQGRMSYPTSLYLDEAVSLLSPVPGYLTPDQIMPILTYFGENIYKNKKWDDYLSELAAQNNGGGGAAGK